MAIQIKRVYEEPSPDDGYRILVDRIWPRGVSKEHAAVEEWLKEVAPTTELRTWWNHDPARVGEFTSRYRAELDGNPTTVAALGELRALIKRNDKAHQATTLVYSAKDTTLNQARVLADYLNDSHPA